VTVTELSAGAGDPEALLGVTSFVEDHRTYRLDLTTGEVQPVSDATGDAPVPRVTVTRARATSRDGTQVPYFLLRPADAPTDRPLPTMLYGYGGFYQSMTPSYKPAWPAWLAAGGVLVVANLRGGGEYGREWYE